MLVPVLLVTTVVRAQWLYRGGTLGLGIGLFGQPIFDRLKPETIINWLDTHLPHWRGYLELRNTILSGIPTNAQITITLLRIGEVNHAPLPPPPPVSAQPDASAHQGIDMAAHPDIPEDQRSELERKAAKQQEREIADRKAASGEAGAKPAGKKKALLFGLLKGSAKIGVETLLGANRVKASIGSLPSKMRLGVVQDPLDAERRRTGDGPISFRARHKGKRGLLFISTQATSPCISFELVSAITGKLKSETTQLKDKLHTSSSDGPAPEGADKEDEDDDHTQQTARFSIAIDDIDEIQKVGGLSWASKIVVGWTLGSEVADGLEIIDSAGKIYKLTAVNRRDECFNRLVSIGKQRWELL